MRRVSFAAMQCPIARTLEDVGEWWSILILRDAFMGLRRFDQFKESLGIAPNMLSRRLSSLVQADMLKRRRYQERPFRYEYLPTEKAQNFRPVLWALMAFGNADIAPENQKLRLTGRDGHPVDPIFVDRRTGRPLTEGVEFDAAPDLHAQIRRVLERVDEVR